MSVFFHCWGASKQHNTVLSNLEILVLMKISQRCALVKRTEENHSYKLIHIYTHIDIYVCIWLSMWGASAVMANIQV